MARQCQCPFGREGRTVCLSGCQIHEREANHTPGELDGVFQHQRGSGGSKIDEGGLEHYLLFTGGFPNPVIRRTQWMVLDGEGYECWQNCLTGAAIVVDTLLGSQ